MTELMFYLWFASYCHMFKFKINPSVLRSTCNSQELNKMACHSPLWGGLYWDKLSCILTVPLALMFVSAYECLFFRIWSDAHGWIYWWIIARRKTLWYHPSKNTGNISCTYTSPCKVNTMVVLPLGWFQSVLQLSIYFQDMYWYFFDRHLALPDYSRYFWYLWVIALLS